MEVTWTRARGRRPGPLTRIRDGLHGRRWVLVNDGPLISVQRRNEDGVWVDIEKDTWALPGATYVYRARIPERWAPRANWLGVLRHRVRVRLYDARYGYDRDSWAEDD